MLTTFDKAIAGFLSTYIVLFLTNIGVDTTMSLEDFISMAVLSIVSFVMVYFASNKK